MEQNKTNDIMMDNNQLYMTFESDGSYRNDIINSIFTYAQNVCVSGYEYFEKNFIRCCKASTSSVQWYYDSAKLGDRYYSFSCASVKTGLKISVFVNSRKMSDYSNGEVYFVRLALSNDTDNSKGCKGRMGTLRNISMVQDYEDLWAKELKSDIELRQTA